MMGTESDDAADAVGPTPERMAKGGVVGGQLTDRAGVFGHRSAECLLDRLFLTGYFGALDEPKSRQRYDAGMWLRRCYERAGLDGTVTSGWGRSRGSGDIGDPASIQRALYDQVVKHFDRRRMHTLCEVSLYERMASGRRRKEVLATFDALAKFKGIA